MQAWLRVSHQRANLQEVRLLPLTIVGRSAECHLKIASAQVSRRHCQIMLRTDGVYIEDLASANGTFLDGARLPSRTPTYVQSGSRLEIGPAKFIVDYQAAAAASAKLPTAGDGTAPQSRNEADDLGDNSDEEEPSDPAAWSEVTGASASDEATVRISASAESRPPIVDELAVFAEPASTKAAAPTKRSFFSAFSR